MPTSRPIAPDMLAVIAEWLRAEVLPLLADDKNFNLRVALNMLAMVERELRQGPALDAAEAARLQALLGRPGAADELTRALCAEIRSGARPTGDPALLAHLRASIDAALRINNPKWQGGQS